MPFVRVCTNLSRNQLPKDFMPRFSGFLATVLEKEPEKFKWQLETDKIMGQGAALDGGRKPFLLVEIETLKVFDTVDNCKICVPKVFDYLEKETGLKQEEIIAKLHPLLPQHVGSMGKTMLG